MRKSILDSASGIVVNVILLEAGAQWTPPTGQQIGSDGGEIGDRWDGSQYVRPSPPAPPAPSLGDYKTAIQELIDAVARAKDYDSGVSLAGYKGSSVDTYAADAEAFTNWRDPLWSLVFRKLADVQSGAIPQPTISELLAMLPAPPWPLQ